MKIITGILFCQFLLFAVSAWGYAGGDGSAGNPWQITNRSELEAVNNDLTAHYILMNDIDLGDTNFTGSVIARWGGSSWNSFSGEFNGNYKTISNLTIEGENANEILGFFGCVCDGGVVKSLRLENCNISGDDTAGMLAGYIWEQVLICDCHVSGNVSGGDEVGGLIGECENSSIIRCASEGAVAGANSVGGLVGFFDGYSFAYNIREGFILNSYASCSVNADQYVGGLIGVCYAGVIANCYASGHVNGVSDANGLIGIVDNGSVRCCFWNKDTSGQTEGTACGYGGEGITSAEMSQQSTFTSEGWIFSEAENAFTGVWYMPDEGFPVLYRWSGEMIKVPEIEHLDLPGVVSALELAGFEIGATNYVNSMTVSNSAVVGISLKEGGLCLTNNSPVDIYISLGPDGDGSESDPYPIACEDDLLNVNNDLTAHYILVRDIYLTNLYATAAIAKAGALFAGIFDGNGKKVVGLHIEEPSSDYIGLFGRLGAGAEIKDLTLLDVQIDSVGVNGCSLRSFAGSISAYASENSKIVNCHGYGVVNGGEGVGGIVGENSGDLLKCSFNGFILAELYCGGVIGISYRNGKAQRSCFQGVVLCLDGGGFIGYNWGLIEFCYAVGGVCADGGGGGFVARNNSHGVIQNCFSQAEDYDGIDYGGFVGWNEGGTIRYSYACGARRLLSSRYPSGFISEGNVDNITECFFDEDVFGGDGDLLDGHMGIDTISMRTVSTYTDAGWVFYESSSGRVDGWYMPENDYPVLPWQNPMFLVVPELEGLTLSEMQNILVDAGFTLGSVIYTNSMTVASGVILGASVVSGCSYVTNAPPVDIYISSGSCGDGSASAPYPIACEADLQAVNNDLTAHYSLVRSFSLQDSYLDAVVGDYFVDFSGVINGNGNIVSDLFIDSEARRVGLFKSLEEGKIINLNVENAEVIGYGNCAILLGSNRGGIISNCCVQGQVTGSDGVGGLVGGNYSFTDYYPTYITGIVTRCRARVDVNGNNNVGGLVGSTGRGSVFYSSSQGNVVGNESVGGLVGSTEGGILLNSFSSARVEGSDEVGGLVGFLGWDSVEQCFSTGKVIGDYYTGGFAGYTVGCDIRNCYSTSDVQDGQDVGGFTGLLKNSAADSCYAAGVVSGNEAGGFVKATNNSSATSCFWDVDVSGVTESAAGVGTNTVAMQDETTFIDSGWDFINIWYMAGYPKLRGLVDSSEDKYHLWVFDAGASTGEREQADSPAGDNIPNLLKYAIGLDPLTHCSTADLMLPDLEQSERKFTVTYQRSKDAKGVSLYPTWSASLISSGWRSDGFEVRKLSETTTTELWEASLPLDENSSAFIRLNAEFIAE